MGNPWCLLPTKLGQHSKGWLPQPDRGIHHSRGDGHGLPVVMAGPPLLLSLLKKTWPQQ